MMSAKRAKREKRTKQQKPGKAAVQREAAVEERERAAAEHFVHGVLVRGEAAKAVRGKLPPGVTHEIIEGCNEGDLPKIRRRRFSLI